MAIVYWAGGWLKGLSTDTKPDHAGLGGYNFLESDTGKIYHHNGTSWSLVNSDYIGTWYAGGPSANGLFANLVSETGSASVVEDGTNNPQFRRYVLASNGELAGWMTFGTRITKRGFLPMFTTKIRVDSAALDDYNLYACFHSNPTENFTGTSDLNSDSGIGLIHREQIANFEVVHNDGGATQVNTAFDTPPSATDGNIHTLTVITDNDSPGSFTVIFDSESKTVTTTIPASSGKMLLAIRIESKTATSFNFDIWPILFKHTTT